MQERWSVISRAHRGLLLSLSILVAVPATGSGQAPSLLSTCTQGTLANCAMIQLTSQLGVGPGGLNLFEIAIHNGGSQTDPGMATTIYNLVFGTGQSPAVPGTEVDVAAVPTALGGAAVADPSAWDLFDSGDAIFLSAIMNNGVGSCVAGAPVGGFTQSGQTCGTDQFFSFSLFTSRIYDPVAFSLLDLEVVGLTDRLPADSCSDVSACTVSVSTPTTATPEPSALVLALTGFSGLGAVRLRRRSRVIASRRGAQ